MDDFIADGIGATDTGTGALAADLGAAGRGGADGGGAILTATTTTSGGIADAPSRATLAAGLGPAGITSLAGSARLLAALSLGGAAISTGSAVVQPLLFGRRTAWTPPPNPTEVRLADDARCRRTRSQAIPRIRSGVAGPRRTKGTA